MRVYFIKNPNFSSQICVAMNDKLTASAEVMINATAKDVWDALTKPELIKKYFFGTDTITDWVPGHPIRFKGEWEGKTYEDRGTVLEVQPYKKICYNYWSSMSGKEDKPGNYANITYWLFEDNGRTRLEISQDGVEDMKVKEHSENNWKMVLHNLKNLLEGKGEVKAF
jgi:uncharacterized protein YndB with AHSA1/START domain